MFFGRETICAFDVGAVVCAANLVDRADNRAVRRPGCLERP
jgi:hypothetical protein